MEIFKLLYANKLRLKRGKLLWIGLGVSLGYNILLLVMNYIELVNHIGNSIVAINWYLLSSFRRWAISARSFAAFLLEPIIARALSGTR